MNIIPQLAPLALVFWHCFGSNWVSNETKCGTCGGTGGGGGRIRSSRNPILIMDSTLAQPGKLWPPCSVSQGLRVTPNCFISISDARECSENQSINNTFIPSKHHTPSQFPKEHIHPLETLYNLYIFKQSLRVSRAMFVNSINNTLYLIHFTWFLYFFLWLVMEKKKKIK